MSGTRAHALVRTPLLAMSILVSIPSIAIAGGTMNDDAETAAPAATVAETVTVTANRAELPKRRVGSSVSVLEQEEIEALAKTTLAEVLRTLPGLEVVRSGPSGQVTSVFLRGGSSSHTLVLLDGVRLNSATTGAFDFADLSADRIERIEVLRGPQSTLYGSEAMAGVISITTREGREGLHLDALGEVGEEGRHRLRLGLEGGEGPWRWGLTVSDLREDGLSAASEALGNREADPHESSTLVARGGYAFEGEGRVDLSIRAFSGKVAVDGFDFATGNPIDNLVATNERDNLTTGLTYSQVFGRWRQRLTLGASDDELLGREPGGFGNFEIDSRSLELGGQTDFEPAEGQTYTFGYSWEERQGGSVGSFDESTRLASFYLQGSWAVADRLFLTAGGRRDDHSDFGGETTYRGTASWLFPEASARIHASYGTGFKAPTLNDLFFPGFSNPGLAPETSRGWDAGVEVEITDRLTADLTYFRIDFSDLIAFDFVTFTPQNIAEARSEGLELALTYRASERWQLAATHTHNETEDQATGLQLARRPERRSTLRLDLRPMQRLRATLTVLAVGERIDSDTRPLPDYERLDLALRFRLSQPFEAYLRVENLADEDYEEVRGFSAPGAVATVGLGLGLRL